MMSPPNLGSLGLMDGQVLIGGSMISQADITYLSSWKQYISKIMALIPIDIEDNGGRQPIPNGMTNLLPFILDLECDEHPKSSHLVYKL